MGLGDASEAFVAGSGEGRSWRRVSARGNMLRGNAADTVMTGNRMTLVEMIRAHRVDLTIWEPPV